jgi:hypothetical protein
MAGLPPGGTGEEFYIQDVNKDGQAYAVSVSASPTRIARGVSPSSIVNSEQISPRSTVTIDAVEGMHIKRSEASGSRSCSPNPIR